MTFKEFFSFRANRMLWGNLLAIFILSCLLIVGIWIGLKYYTRHGETVEIPTVKGLDEADAINLIRSRKLRAVIADSIYIKGMKGGQIVEQNPIPGAHVKEGRVVYLTINSLSVPTMKMPDIANNSSLRQATAKLSSYGFRLTEEEYIEGDNEWVYDVKMNGRSIPAGSPVPIGATLTLVVGNGHGEGLTDSLNYLYIDSLLLEENASSPELTPEEPRTNTPETSTPKRQPQETQPTKPVHEDSWF